MDIEAVGVHHVVTPWTSVVIMWFTLLVLKILLLRVLRRPVQKVGQMMVGENACKTQKKLS